MLYTNTLVAQNTASGSYIEVNHQWNLAKTIAEQNSFLKAEPQLNEVLHEFEKLDSLAAYLDVQLFRLPYLQNQNESVQILKEIRTIADNLWRTPASLRETEKYISLLFNLAYIEHEAAGEREAVKTMHKARRLALSKDIELSFVQEKYQHKHPLFQLAIGLNILDKAKSLHKQKETFAALRMLEEALAIFQQADKLSYFIQAWLDKVNWTINEYGMIQGLALMDTVRKKIWRAPLTNAEKERLGYFESYYGYRWRGTDLPKARAAYERAERIYEGMNKDKAYMAQYIFKPLGNIYDRLGDFELAEFYLVKAFSILNERKNYASANQLYSDVGRVCYKQGKYIDAINYLRLGLSQPQLSTQTEGMLKANMADTYFEQKELKLSRKYAEEALQAFRQDDPSVYSFTMYRLLGLMDIREGLFEDAEAKLNKAENEFYAFSTRKDRRLAELEINRGELYLTNLQFEKAIETFQRAIKLLIPGFQHSSVDEMPDASSLYAEPLLYLALVGKTEAYFRLLANGKATAGKDYLGIAINTFALAQSAEQSLHESYIGESSRFLRIEASHVRTERLLDALYSLYETIPDAKVVSMGLALMETTKAVLMQESIQQQTRLLDTEVRKQVQQLKSDSYFYAQRLQNAILEGDTTAVEKHREEMLEARRKYQEFVKDHIPKSHIRGNRWLFSEGIQSLESYLENDQAIIEYHEGEQHIYAILLAKGQVHFVKTNKGSDYEDHIQTITQVHRELRNAGSLLQKDKLLPYLRASYFLYEKLWQPLVQAAGGSLPTRIMVIPDGLMRYLSFDCLLSEEAEELRDLRTYRYLLNDAVISTQFSLALWIQIKNRERKFLKLPYLGIAPGFEADDPVYEELPYSRDELLKAWWAYHLVGKSGNSEAFKRLAKQFRVIHISSHASTDDAFPLRSYVAFYHPVESPSSKERFTLAELYAQQLETDLVVLSACETATGKLRRGEGRLSLARGFTMAGSKSILSTQWQVNHASHVQIIQNFFQYLGNGSEKDVALHKAKEVYLKNCPKDLAHPFFWAATTINGDMSPIQIAPIHPLFEVFIVGGFLLIILLIIYKRNSKQK